MLVLLGFLLPFSFIEMRLGWIGEVSLFDGRWWETLHKRKPSFGADWLVTSHADICNSEAKLSKPLWGWSKRTNFDCLLDRVQNLNSKTLLCSGSTQERREVSMKLAAGDQIHPVGLNQSRKFVSRCCWCLAAGNWKWNANGALRLWLVRIRTSCYFVRAETK